MPQLYGQFSLFTLVQDLPHNRCAVCRATRRHPPPLPFLELMSALAAAIPVLDPIKAEFRQAMAHLGAAVNIITSNGPGGRCGITASAVCSVTDTPPMLLICINRNSAMHAILEQNVHLCVNVLPGHHEELAKHFSGMTKMPMAERFEIPVWNCGTNDVPVLKDALASFQGRITELKPVGSHSVIFMEIDQITIAANGDSLIYFARNFCRVARDNPAMAS